MSSKSTWVNVGSRGAPQLIGQRRIDFLRHVERQMRFVAIVRTVISWKPFTKLLRALFAQAYNPRADAQR